MSTILLLAAGWVAVSLVAACFVGRFIAFGRGPEVSWDIATRPAGATPPAAAGRLGVPRPRALPPRRHRGTSAGDGVPAQGDPGGHPTFSAGELPAPERFGAGTWAAGAERTQIRGAEQRRPTAAPSEQATTADPRAWEHTGPTVADEGEA